MSVAMEVASKEVLEHLKEEIDSIATASTDTDTTVLDEPQAWTREGQVD